LDHWLKKKPQRMGQENNACLEDHACGFVISSGQQIDSMRNNAIENNKEI
jgi:hypothetical protein